MSIQYLLIDSHHDEIVATHPKMSEAMAHRDQLEGRTELPVSQPVSNYNLPPAPSSKCEELAHE
jgi:hypothetical protein